MIMDQENETLSAILLDDEFDARKNAKLFFEEQGVNLITSENIEEFIKSTNNILIILSDLDLKNISTTENGISVLIEVRHFIVMRKYSTATGNPITR